MSQDATPDAAIQGESSAPAQLADADAPAEPAFILYKEGEDYRTALGHLISWVNGLLIPVYCHEATASAPWCSRWWEHTEAIAQFYGLWMAWHEMTGAHAAAIGPASWHRDFLTPVMGALRNPAGPFAACKPGSHRIVEPPDIEYPRG